MPEWFLVLVFSLSLALVVHGWGLILSLAFALEKRRFGWPDEEALQKSLRRPRGQGGDQRMRQYIREDLRDYAEETGQGARHRRARLSLAAGYAGAIASGLVWIIGQVL